MAKLLDQQGNTAVIVDDLSSGHRRATGTFKFLEGNIGDASFINTVLDEIKPAVVMHFASFIQAGESVTNPAKYYKNNVVATQVLLDAMINHNINKLIFSSTAAIFGNPEYLPIDEDHPKNPINPYGRTKWIVEQMLEDYDHAYGLKSIALRYFNAAGADPEGKLGECHEPETHLIPLVLQAASGRRPEICIYGNDYDTPDGTCIRDYVHVVDLCSAHLQALEKLLAGKDSDQYNLGNVNGYSVAEVFDTVTQVTERHFTNTHTSRREGGAARLVADSARAHTELGREPHYVNLDTIIGHAWN